MISSLPEPDCQKLSQTVGGISVEGHHRPDGKVLFVKLHQTVKLRGLVVSEDQTLSLGTGVKKQEGRINCVLNVTMVLLPGLRVAPAASRNSRILPS